jgi:hypothetical protein
MKTATKLRKFRQQFEREAGTPATHIEAPVAHVLNDVCRALGLKGRERKRVLGRKSTVLLEDTRNERVELVERR